ncbi:conjugative transposon protein TraK [Mucilaginibacter pineti]|uniref:conjugative transposon protein TraK n=1 Tax=Mucilaginibacter pineti TaxID=1391627 RepID=UPI000B8445B7
MFRQMKNVDTAFRYIRTFSGCVIGGVVLLAGFIAWKSYRLASETQQKIYVLGNGKALEAFAADRRDNIPVEARDHIKTFHQLFFTLSPDEKAIAATISKSLYLADESAKAAYDNLKESNYFSNLISGNVSQAVRVDSVYVDINQYPYYFKCHATEIITRTSSVVTRSLVTEGYLRNVSRSDNNSHGMLIERWETLENKDLTIQRR